MRTKPIFFSLQGQASKGCHLGTKAQNDIGCVLKVSLAQGPLRPAFSRKKVKRQGRLSPQNRPPKPTTSINNQDEPQECQVLQSHVDSEGSDCHFHEL